MVYTVAAVFAVLLYLVLTEFSEELFTLQEWMYIIVLMLAVGFLLNVQRKS
jgi:integral membrane sensor domain MASE1